MPGLIIDNFAGGGGASLGIEQALGRPVDYAINHDAQALAMHAANHPATTHLCEDVWDVDPKRVAAGRAVELAWFSPDCKHFSKAKGGKPVDKRIRGLAWVAVRWAASARPRLIVVENVEEFQSWGPLVEGRPCPARRGLTFRRWVGELERLGYRVEWRELRACDYGAPTIRKRLFVVARRGGLPIVWPTPSHGPGLRPYRTAAECIDWSIPCPSIFTRKRPLVEATMRRIARGVVKFVLEAEAPFIVPGEPAAAPYLVPRHGEREGQEPRCRQVDLPLPTVTPTANGAGLVAASLTRNFGNSVGGALADPAPTATGCNKTGLVAAFLAQHNGGMTGHAADKPLSTIVLKGSTQALVAAHLTHNYTSNTNGGNGELRVPHKTVTTGGHHALVAAFLAKYYGTAVGQDLFEPLHTATPRSRFGLVTVIIAGTEYAIVDIGMRMLSPRELFRAQGFPDSYVIAPEVDGKPLTKTAQTKACGNSVCPDVARAVVVANTGAAALREVG